MQEQDKIYGLIVQAQEMQRFALEFRATAEDALKRLPDASRRAVSDAAQQILIEGAEKAAKSLLEASGGAIAAAAELHSAQSWALAKHIAVLVLVAAVIVASLYFGAGYLVSSRIAEAQRLGREVIALEARAADFSKRAGKAVLTDCGGRLCVQVDAKAPVYDGRDGEVFRILHGY